jgi:DNA-directed RNA polymerase specialized sigma24 family protein
VKRHTPGHGGTEAEFTAFVVAHRLTLVRTAAVMLGRPGHDAEDLVQTALVKLAPRWGEVAQPLPYIRQILARLVVDAARQRGRRPERLGLVVRDL